MHWLPVGANVGRSVGVATGWIGWRVGDGEAIDEGGETDGDAVCGKDETGKDVGSEVPTDLQFVQQLQKT